MRRNKVQDLDKVGINRSQDVTPHSLGDFLAWVRSAGLQKTNRFFVDIALPRPLNFNAASTEGTILSRFKESAIDAAYRPESKRIERYRRDILLACEEINVPPRSIQTRTLRLGGLNEKRANTIDYGGDFTLTFLVDNTHEVQEFFERWMNIEVNQTTREVGEYTDYASTVDLWFLRPFTPNETYNALSRYQSGSSRFLSAAKDRVLNLAASEVGRFKTRLRTAFDTQKRKVIGSNIGVYNRLKAVLPLELLVDANNGPSDFAMYKISFKEAFPTQITRSVMSHGGTDVMRITVQFAFKEYETLESGLQKSSPDDNPVFNFIKRVGIPTSKSAIARSALNLL